MATREGPLTAPLDVGFDYTRSVGPVLGRFLTALRDEAPPGRVPDQCIQQLYKKFSAFYENNMVETLSYEGPQHLGEVLSSVLGDRAG